MKENVDNIFINFNIAVEHPEKYNLESIINAPIMSEDKVVGIITEAKIDESGYVCNCKGVIWGRFVKFEMFKNNQTFEFRSVVI
jgi:predicted transcriptional regulator